MARADGSGRRPQFEPGRGRARHERPQKCGLAAEKRGDEKDRPRSGFPQWRLARDNGGSGLPSPNRCSGRCPSPGYRLGAFPQSAQRPMTTRPSARRRRENDSRAAPVPSESHNWTKSRSRVGACPGADDPRLRGTAGQRSRVSQARPSRQRSRGELKENAPRPAAADVSGARSRIEPAPRSARVDLRPESHSARVALCPSRTVPDQR